MFNINPISSVNNFTVQNKPSFKSNVAVTNLQIKELQDVKSDFAVKTPISYTKTGEINFPYDTKAHCYKLSNGQKVIIVPQDGETVLRTYVNTGSMNEPDNIRGISHYIEHNLFNGSEGLEEGDFFKQVDKMGASTNASTGFAETNYHIRSNLLNKGDLEKKIKLHASMLETPLFAVEKLEKEKGIVNSEINMITSDPENIAINKMLKNLYGIKTSSTDMIAGNCDNITNLKREDVVNYYNNNYYPSNMVTVITGDVSPDETMQLISKYFSSKRQPTAPQHFETFAPIQNSVREDIISDKATAATTVVGFSGPASNNTKDRIYVNALGVLLSNSPIARINNRIKPLNAETISDQEKISSNPNDSRAIMFISESNEEDSEKVLKSIYNEIGNIANNPPTEKEMKAIKNLMLRDFSDTFEYSFATNNAIGTAILENNNDYLNNAEQIINSMTSQDLVNTAKKYLDLNKASVTVVHPASATEQSIKNNYNNSISFTGNGKKQAINPDAIKEYNTQNNYRVITQNSKTNNVNIIYNLYTDKDINIKPAASMVLSRLLNEGTMAKTQEQLDAELAENGITKGLWASENSISCSLDCDVNTISDGFENIKNIILTPRFTQQDFELAKNRLKNELLISEKSAYDKLDTELFKGTPNGFSKEEILASLETLTLNDIMTLYKLLLENSKGTIAISAPFDKKPELKNIIFNKIVQFPRVKEFKPKELENTFHPTETSKVLTDVDSKNQAEILQAYKFKINRNIKDTACLQLLNIILGSGQSSRLFMDLRENEKLAYHVRSGYRPNKDTGVITLKILTTTDNKETGEKSYDNVQKSLEGFKRHIEKLKSEKVSEEELNNAKLAFKNTIITNNNCCEEKNSNLIGGAKSQYGTLKDNVLLDEIDKITVDDIYNTAKYVFSNKPIYSIVATEDTLNANREYLNNLAT